jgi:unsaturated rhamnogalacturonyl hydrolase
MVKTIFKKRNIIASLAFLTVFCYAVNGQSISRDSKKWSEIAAVSILNKYPNTVNIDGNEKPKWDYKMGFTLFSFQKLYQKTKDKKYLDYIKEYADTFIDTSGNIAHYESKEYNIDCLNPANVLFDLYETTKDERYHKAIDLLRKQLYDQPRTDSGGFWHKQIYPNQMWIDGLYMAEPFYTQYTVKYEKGKALDDIAKQFELVQNHFVDKKTGLLYQAWDESKQIGWANPETGTSPILWARGMGWYAMALVEVLDYYPKNHPKQKVLVGYLKQLAKALDANKSAAGLWYQVADKTTLEGNYLEPSASAMIIYAFAKGANKGYLPSNYKKEALKSYDGFLKEFVKYNENGDFNILNVSPNVGLGGTPFRDGSNDYYIKGKTKDNASVGVTAFILASLELNK